MAGPATASPRISELTATKLVRKKHGENETVWLKIVITHTSHVDRFRQDETHGGGSGRRMVREPDPAIVYRALEATTDWVGTLHVSPTELLRPPLTGRVGEVNVCLVRVWKTLRTNNSRYPRGSANLLRLAHCDVATKCMLSTEAALSPYSAETYLTRCISKTRLESHLQVAFYDASVFKESC